MPSRPGPVTFQYQTCCWEPKGSPFVGQIPGRRRIRDPVAILLAIKRDPWHMPPIVYVSAAE